MEATVPPVEVLLPNAGDAARRLAREALPNRDVRTREPDLPPVATAAERGYAGLPRELAEDVARRLEEIDPSFFTRWVDGWHMRSSFVYVLTLELGMTFLPQLHAFLANDITGNEPMVFDGPLAAEQLDLAARRLGHDVGPIGWIHDDERVERSLDSIERSLAPETRSAQEAADKLAHLPCASALIVCGSYPEAERLGELAALMRRRGGSVALAKNNSRECQRTVNHVVNCGATGELNARVLATVPVATEPADQFFRALVELRALLRKLQPDARAFVGKHAAAIARRGRLALGWQRLVMQVRPRLVAGTLDRSSWGPMTAQFPVSREYAVVEVQHGLNVPYGARDLILFDLVLAFNEQSRQAMVDDGYSSERRIAVVGDPRWDALRDSRALRSVPAELRTWKGDDPLLLVLPQPRKGPLMSTGAINALYDSVRMATAASGLKVLVKLRDGHEVDPEAEILDELFEEGRARTVDAEQLGLEQALALADVAVSVFSSALLEALAAGVPCVAVDPDAALAHLGLADAMRSCDNPWECETVLRQVLEGLNAHPVGPHVLPAFRRTYAGRVRRTLRRSGVLPRVRAGDTVTSWVARSKAISTSELAR